MLFTDALGFAFDDPATVATLGGLARACETQALNLLLIPAGPPRPEARHTSVGSAVVDGFVVYSVPDGDVHLKEVLRRGLPTVIIDCPRDTPVGGLGRPRPCGARAFGEHPAAQGHRRIGIIAPRLRAAARRRAGHTADPEPRRTSGSQRCDQPGVRALALFEK